MNGLSITRRGIGLGFYSFFRVSHTGNTKLCFSNTLSETCCGCVRPFGREYKYQELFKKLDNP